MSEQDFMKMIKEYPGWEDDLWFPGINDCHNQLEEAFEYIGVPYPGAPYGRLNIDEWIGFKRKTIGASPLDSWTLAP